MRRLFAYMKAYKKESVLGPLFKMLEASFELFVPLVVARMVDVGIVQRDSGYILKMGGILVLLALIGLACSLTAQYFAAKAATGAATALRGDLFSHIGSLSYGELDRVGASTLITRMTNDINQVQTGINMTLRLLLRSPFVVFGAMIMAFSVDIRSAMIFAVTIPVLCLIVFGIMALTMPLYKKVQKQLDRVLSAVRENLLGVRVIRAFNRQESERIRFEGENDQLVRQQVFVGKLSALLNPFTYIAVNMAIVAVLWTGAGQVDAGNLSQGKVIALVNYMSQILGELVKMANLIVIISKSVACMNRVDQVFLVESTIKERKEIPEAAKREKDTSVPKVEMRQAGFTYAQAKEPSLKGISFQAMAGQTIGIIGGTGSGKTSLVNLIPRFYDVSEGSVLVDGKDVRDYPISGLREKISIAPQKSVLFKGTLKENMLWGREGASDEEIYAALEIAQAREFVEAKGEGLSLFIDQEGRNLSGGQRQRLAVARALVRRPEILILDDSASALDFATDARMRKAIRENTEGITVFLVSQRAASLKGADQILVLDEGRLVGAGSHRELLRTCQVYREICLSQLSKEEVERDEQ